MFSQRWIVNLLMYGIIYTISTGQELSLPEYMVSQCYGDTFNFDCGVGNMIRINQDFFGYSHGDRCEYGGDRDCTMSNPKSNSLIHRYCTGQRWCTHYMVERRACDGYFTNYQQVEYQCIPETKVVSACAETEFEAYSTYIASPNFPHLYPEELDCACVVTTRNPAVRVQMEIVFLAIKFSSPCKDWLKIGHKKTCGTTIEMYSGKVIPIEFHTDSEGGHSGFWLHFQASQPGEPIVVRCGKNVTSNISDLKQQQPSNTTPLPKRPVSAHRVPGRRVPPRSNSRSPTFRPGQDLLDRLLKQMQREHEQLHEQQEQQEGPTHTPQQRGPVNGDLDPQMVMNNVKPSSSPTYQYESAKDNSNKQHSRDTKTLKESNRQVSHTKTEPRPTPIAPRGQGLYPTEASWSLSSSAERSRHQLTDHVQHQHSTSHKPYPAEAIRPHHSELSPDNLSDDKSKAPYSKDIMGLPEVGLPEVPVSLTPHIRRPVARPTLHRKPPLNTDAGSNRNPSNKDKSRSPEVYVDLDSVWLEEETADTYGFDISKSTELSYSYRQPDFVEEDPNEVVPNSNQPSDTSSSPVAFSKETAEVQHAQFHNVDADDIDKPETDDLFNAAVLSEETREEFVYGEDSPGVGSVDNVDYYYYPGVVGGNYSRATAKAPEKKPTMTLGLIILGACAALLFTVACFIVLLVFFRRRRLAKNAAAASRRPSSTSPVTSELSTQCSSSTSSNPDETDSGKGLLSAVKHLPGTLGMRATVRPDSPDSPFPSYTKGSGHQTYVDVDSLYAKPICKSDRQSSSSGSGNSDAYEDVVVRCSSPIMSDSDGSLYCTPTPLALDRLPTLKKSSMAPDVVSRPRFYGRHRRRKGGGGGGTTTAGTLIGPSQGRGFHSPPPWAPGIPPPPPAHPNDSESDNSVRLSRRYRAGGVLAPRIKGFYRGSILSDSEPDLYSGTGSEHDAHADTLLRHNSIASLSGLAEVTLCPDLHEHGLYNDIELSMTDRSADETDWETRSAISI